MVMGYIEHSLGRSETLLYRARFPAVYFVAAWSVLLAAILAALLVYASGYGPLWIGMALLGVAVFLGILVPIWATEIGVTNQRFIFKRGLLWRSTQELQLRAIEEVNLEQGLLGRLLNFGRLELRGTGVDDVLMPALADPMGLRRALQDGMAAAVQAGSPGAPPARAPAA
jgi:membrane protein YdbS with pleckstrin-like domain